MQVWSVDYTLPSKRGQICKHCFYWIVFNTGIYRKVNFEGLLLFLAILVSINVGDGSYKLLNIFLIQAETEA